MRFLFTSNPAAKAAVDFALPMAAKGAPLQNKVKNLSVSAF
jgi:hypothetical protein